MHHLPSNITPQSDRSPREKEEQYRHRKHLIPTAFRGGSCLHSVDISQNQGTVLSQRGR
jgi:hypothetical protein